jgi:ferrous iron transport protein B
MTLLELQNGQQGVISKVKGRGAFRRRIIEMGFVLGKQIKVIKKAPLQDPIEYNIMGYNVTLRSSEAQLIEVIPLDELQQKVTQQYDGVFSSERAIVALKRGTKINVALIGNPNSGKTTFFNHASGSRERVGNYSGVTVDSREAGLRQNGYVYSITDLPGTYSISAYTPEEIFVRDFLTKKMPDVVINIVDASNLERNLYLTTQLIDMDLKVVMVLNMYDELEKKGDKFDYDSLGKMIGIPIIPAVSSKGKGIKETFQKVAEVFEDREEFARHIHINHGAVVEKSIKLIQDKIKIKANESLTFRISSRFLAIRLLENDMEAVKIIMENCLNHEDIIFTAKNEAKAIEHEFGDSPETVITDLKYGFIAGALRETYQQDETVRIRKSQIVDTLITHKLFGIPIFLFFMWAMFSATFTLGEYPMEWLEAGFEKLALAFDSAMNEGPFKDLLINGILRGIGGVLVFLPNIMILFFFIGLMEDTGYMSRAVFIMDKAMHKIGLHGKSFIPLLMGFGCNVPAIMATRTLANRNDRLLTMLINPFMSCSARLPIFVLFISAFFQENQGTMLFLIYCIGVMAAIAAALIFKRTLFRGQEVPFVMELPPYRIPTFKAMTLNMWGKAVHYLRKISGIILVASIIIWALGYFPHGYSYSKMNQQEKQEIIRQVAYNIESSDITDSLAISNLLMQQQIDLAQIEAKNNLQRQEESYIGRIGKTLQPVMEPLGFDWRMTISIISGIAAKEIVVSTLAVLYQVDESVHAQSPNLVERLQHHTYSVSEKKAGEKVLNPVVALSFMLFILLYFPCVGVIAAISKESGSWKWGAFTIIYTTALAWVVAFITYQAGKFFFL